MSDQYQSGQEQSLDDFAAAASQELAQQPVVIENTAASNVQGGQVLVQNSYARSVSAHAVYLENVAAGVLKAQAVEASEAGFGLGLAGSVQATEVSAAVLAAREVTGQNIKTIWLVALRVDGNVRSFISPAAGLAMGAGFAGVLLAARAVGSKLRKRKHASTAKKKK